MAQKECKTTVKTTKTKAKGKTIPKKKTAVKTTVEESTEAYKGTTAICCACGKKVAWNFPHLKNSAKKRHIYCRTCYWEDKPWRQDMIDKEMGVIHND